MNSNIVIVGQCYSLMDYDMKRMFLESHGIDVLADSETTVAVNPFYSAAIGGIRIRVHQKNQALAHRLLREFETASDTSRDVRHDHLPLLKTLIASLALGGLAGLIIGIYHATFAVGLQFFIILTLVSFFPLSQVFRKQEERLPEDSEER